MTAKADVLERVRPVEETAAAWLTRWTLKKADMLHKCDEAHAMVERFKNDLMALCKHVSANGIVQSELHDA